MDQALLRRSTAAPLNTDKFARPNLGKLMTGLLICPDRDHPAERGVAPASPSSRFRIPTILIFVAVTPPTGGLVAALGRAVERLVGAPEDVQAARERGIAVVEIAVHEHACRVPVAGKAALMGWPAPFLGIG